MTWRTALYLLTVLIAAVAVASTALSESSQTSQGAGARMAMVTAPNLEVHADNARRMLLLTVGVGMVALTYRRAYSNIRGGKV